MWPRAHPPEEVYLPRNVAVQVRRFPTSLSLLHSYLVVDHIYLVIGTPYHGGLTVRGLDPLHHDDLRLIAPKKAPIPSLIEAREDCLSLLLGNRV